MHAGWGNITREEVESLYGRDTRELLEVQKIAVATNLYMQ